MSKPALGRGLGALLGGASPTAKPAPPTDESPASPGLGSAGGTGERVQRLALDSLRPCPLQPRKEFAPESLQELADSIKEQGIIQPLIVRPRGEYYELIAGERRWRAAQMLGLKEVPALLREADDRTVLAMALIENLQREDLNSIEEAQGYAELIHSFQLRQEDVAARVGRSRTVVANALRLLKLSPDIQGFLRTGRLSVGHAKVILGLDSPAAQQRAAERILKQNLSVRQAEALVAQWQKLHPTGPDPHPEADRSVSRRDAHVADLENRLQERFGTKVQLRYRQGKGSLEIRFFNDEDLERILQLAGLTVE